MCELLFSSFGQGRVPITASYSLTRTFWSAMLQKLVIVEGLNLDNVEMGLYTVHCLPLKLVQAEGSPIRCVLST